jgi:hypothetical protein
VTAEAGSPLSLDVVRARIFYLACDVETVSPPAAMLLRAVADAIDDGGRDIRLEDLAGAQDIVSLFSQVRDRRTAADAPPPVSGGERRFAVVASRQVRHKR